jgi:hypothetical protein
MEAFFAAGAMAMAASGQRQAAVIFFAGVSVVLFLVYRLGYFRRSPALAEIQRFSDTAIDEAAANADDPAYSTTAG